MSAPPLRRALCLAYGAGSIGAGIFSTIPGLLLAFLNDLYTAHRAGGAAVGASK